MRPWSLATVIVLTLSLVNAVAYQARRRAKAHAAASPEPVAGNTPAPDAGIPLQPPSPPAVATAPGLPPRADPREDDRGLLLVTSAPRGILVEVDGEARDLTPARLNLSPGHHQVVLREGARVLTDEAVEVHTGSAAVVVYTLDAPRPAEPGEVPVAAVQAEP